MLILKSEREIQKMRKAGLYVWHALQIAASMIRPGVTTGAIDQRIETFFADSKAISLFKGFPGKVPYPSVTCVSVNEQVVHGIPGSRALAEGDIVSVDTGCKIDGWCGDSAWTWPVGEVSDGAKRLMEVCQNVLQMAIDLIPKKKKWSDVVKDFEPYVQRAGFSLIDRLVGHGIGREMHEEPQVPNCDWQRILKRDDFPLQPGLVIAIEPMVNMGRKSIVTGPDHWTISAADKKLSAHFEHTVAITANGVRILTGPPIDDSEKIDISKYLQ